MHLYVLHRNMKISEAEQNFLHNDWTLGVLEFESTMICHVIQKDGYEQECVMKRIRENYVES